MNKAQITVLALSIAALAGCGSMAHKDHEKTGWDRLPASEAPSPLADGTQMRVVKKMKLQPVSASGNYGAYVSNGRLLSGLEAKDLNEKNSANLSRYCILYTASADRSVSVEMGEVLKLRQVPSSDHFEPGHIYAVEGVANLSAIGCFVLSPNGRAEVSERMFRDQLNGLLEITN
jgi:hypothetical protein